MGNASIHRSAVRQDNRNVVDTLRGVAAEDGAGVKLTRIIGSPELDMWDPFLLLDRFESDNPDDYIAGFPPHPHRGFETVTYLLAGRMRHEDSTGRAGIIEPGGVQWMTAGRGIVHSEMPEQIQGRLAGFQLWVNLPASQKMTAPRYQEFPRETIPLERRDQGVEIRVIAGTTSKGTRGPVENVATEPCYFDVALDAGGAFSESVCRGHGAFLYVIDGAVEVLAARGEDDRIVPLGSLALLGDGERVEIIGTEPHNHILLVSAKRLAEPVSRAGPFVMNTREEIIQAFEDYKKGRF